MSFWMGEEALQTVPLRARRQSLLYVEQPVTAGLLEIAGVQPKAAKA